VTLRVSGVRICLSSPPLGAAFENSHSGAQLGKDTSLSTLVFQEMSKMKHAAHLQSVRLLATQRTACMRLSCHKDLHDLKHGSLIYMALV
jgi:hypothetical protein